MFRFVTEIEAFQKLLAREEKKDSLLIAMSCSSVRNTDNTRKIFMVESKTNQNSLVNGIKKYFE